jgi:hypothetical protein
MTDLESLAQRLLALADQPLLRNRPDLRPDLQMAADVVHDYAALLHMSRKGMSDRDYGGELARLLCPEGLPGERVAATITHGADDVTTRFWRFVIRTTAARGSNPSACQSSICSTAVTHFSPISSFAIML